MSIVPGPLPAGRSWQDRLSNGGIRVLGLRGTGLALALGLNILLARLLGLPRYGEYVFLTVLAAFAAVPARAGMDVAVMRFLPEYRAAGTGRLARRLMTRSNALVGALGLALALLVLAGLALFPARRVTAGSLAWLLALVPLTALSSLNQGILQGLGQPARALWAEYLVRPLAAAAVLLVLLGLHPASLTVGQGLSAVTLGVGCGVLVQWLLIRRAAAGLPVEAGEPAIPWRTWLGVAWPLLGVGLLNMMSTRSDLLLLGALGNRSSEGYYQPAVRLAGFVSFGLTALNGVVAPLIAELYTQKRLPELRGVVNRTIRWGSAFGISVALVLWLGGRFVLHLFGPGFGAGRGPLAILLLGQVVNVSVGPVGYFLAMTGSHRAAFWILCLGAALEVATALLAIPLWGALGAALAASLALAGWNLAMVVYLRRRHGWWILPFYGISGPIHAA
jgi:O-antigen/teichoic acid export membrane protein